MQRLLLPSPLPRAAGAPFRRGLRPEEARVYLALAPLGDARVELIDAAAGCFAVHGRKAVAAPRLSPPRYDPRS
jgi:hypothetical protein